MRICCILRRGLLALWVGLAAAPTLADDCDAPVQQWQPREALRRMAATRGWEVERIKIDDGCYEIRGTDASGRAFKAKQHDAGASLAPVVNEVAKVEIVRDDDPPFAEGDVEQLLVPR